MESVYKYKNYRDIIRNTAKDRGYKIKDLAKITGCSHSYLSQVLTAEKANLNKDQCLKLALEFKFNSQETRFFLLHVDLANAGTHELIEHIKSELDSFYMTELNPDKATKAKQLNEHDAISAEYFANYLYMTVHLATACSQFQTVESIANRFHISKKETEDVLEFLLNHKFVKKIQNKFIYNGSSVHLKKYTSVYKNYHQALRINSLLKYHNQDYNYSSLFAIEKNDLIELKSLLYEFVQKKEKITENSGSEDVYLLCIDLLLA